MAPQGVPVDDSEVNERNAVHAKKSAASPDGATAKGRRTRSKSKNKLKREGSEMRSTVKKVKIAEIHDISQTEIHGDVATDEKSSGSENIPSSDNGGNTSETSEDRNSDVGNKDQECPKCFAVFTEASVFNKHLISHNPPGDDKTCGICDKVLCSASSRDRHMLVHSKFKGYKCKKCDATFSTNGNMNRHRNKSVCASIGQKAKTPEIKEEVVDQSIPNATSENTDDSFSQYVKEFPEQELAEGFQDLTCFEFSSEKFPFFAKVTCERTSKFPIGSLQTYRCSICEFPFPSQLSLEKHQSCHVEDTVLYCKLCDTHFPSKSEEEEHIARYHPEDAMSSVAEQRKQDVGDSFLARLGLQKNNNVGSREVSKCNSFLEEARLEDGGDVEHRSDESAMDTSEDFENNLNQNEIAELVPDTSADQNQFEEVDASATQQNSIEPDADIPDVLTKMDSISLQSHASTDHTPRASATSSNNDLAEIRDIILNLKYVPGTTKPAENDPFPMEIGPPLIEQTYVKKLDQKTGKPKKSIEKSHHCPECDYQSGDNSTLKRHVRCKHRRERTFRCIQCEKTFTYKNNAERHAKSVHKFEDRESINACIASFSESSSAHSAEKHFCKFCEESFENEQAQKHHVRSNSCKQKPFVCKICDTGCSTKNNCHRHILKNHADLFKEATEEERKSIQIDNTTVNYKKTKPDQTTEPIASGSETDRSLSERDEAAQSLLRLRAGEEGNQQVNGSPEPIDLSVRPLDLSMSNPPSKWQTDACKSISEQSKSSDTNKDASAGFQNAGTSAIQKLQSKIDLKCNPSVIKNYKCTIRQQTPRQMSCLKRRRRNRMLMDKLRSRSAVFKNGEIAGSSHTNRKFSHNDNYQTKEIGVGFQMKHPIKPGLSSNSYGRDNHSDSENQDFASVRSVISTANSTKFPLEDVNCNSLGGSATDATSHSKNNGNNAFGFKLRNEDKEAGKKDCRTCGRSFQWRSSLERHLVKHTGEKPFPCEVCNTKFSTKSNLRRHMVKKHQRHFQQLPRSETSFSDLPQSTDGSNLSQSTSDASTPLDTDAELSDPTSEYLECKFCSTPFSNDNDLVNHTKELHVLEYAKMQGVNNVLTDIKSEWKNAPPKRRK